MNYNQTFEEFSKGLSSTDLALYAGAGLILFVLFKDRLSPVQKLLGDLLSQAKGIVAKPIVTESQKQTLVTPASNDVFFDLIASWKQTRDLAVKSGCSEAVKVADQMFPYLSPTVCGEEKA